MATRKRRASRSSKTSSADRHAAAKRAAADLVQDLRGRGIDRAKIGGFDIDGVLRGKYVSLDKLESALGKGFGFCDVIFGWDVADALYDNVKLTGWHTGYPDAQAVLDPSTLRNVPWEPGVAAMLADFRVDDGSPHPACPRSLLKRVIARAEKLGFRPMVGAEYEFYMFKETRDSLQEKAFRRLSPLDPGMFGYSWVRSGQDAELMRDIIQGLRDFDIELEGLHTETGPGVYEGAIRFDDALKTADRAALFKVAMKQIAHRHDVAVTFMAKWNGALPGSSGHLHQSLWQGDENAFIDAKGTGMSKLMQQYLAGQVALMPELTAMVSPTINSYKRYVPGVWAPLVACWGVENRTCSCRVIGLGQGSALRIEHRQPAADMNPYVALAATLAAGLWGIEKGLSLPPETRGDAGTDGPGRLPRTLREATERFAASKAARALFGSEFVDHYASTRAWEVREYDKAVTDWELARYFEVI
ncbi:MAG TPA: glutamine synthetase family protein [Polyangiaceae bacterium]|nr:glutamine synthetase family protein [Polyangiaceae bacterium]